MSTDIHALSGAYALDALDAEERAEFEVHLAGCEACREEVQGLREAAGMLSELAVEEPPARLRADLMDRIGQVRPLPPQPAPVESQPEPEHRSTTDLDSARRRGSGLGVGRPGRFGRAVPLLAAAAAAIVAVGVGARVLTGDRDEAPGPNPTASPTLSTTERVLEADDAQRASVSLPGGGRAVVVRSVSQRRAVLIAQKMPPAGRGKVYQAWFQTPRGQMVPAGLMPDARNTEVLLTGDASEITAVGLTVEPAGGSQAPTSDPVALWDLTQA